ncbi:hypothetical protein ACWEOR_31540, partial [Micromonospora chalcea]
MRGVRGSGGRELSVFRRAALALGVINSSSPTWWCRGASDATTSPSWSRSSRGAPRPPASSGFEWSEGNPIAHLLRYLILGRGDTPPVVREII